MTGRVFVDSNVWCYALDGKTIDKQSRAISLIEELAKNAQIIVSTQVLNEVYSVATRKLGIEPLVVKNVLRNMRDYDVVVVEPDTIELAIDFSILQQISYWDALMLAAAYQSKCRILLTEDLTGGRVLQGIAIVNPFAG